MKKLRSIVILLILILVPMSILSAEKIDEEKYRTYFLVESENEYNDHVRIDYSFRGEKSSVVVSDGGIEVARFTYLKEDEISTILSKSWILDAAGYDTSDHLTTARTVVEAVAMAKRVAVSMDEYMKSLPEKNEVDPYKDIPVYDEPTVDAFGEQVLGGGEA